jgi:4-hydroxybenzoate polyprenyltransferase
MGEMVLLTNTRSVRSASAATRTALAPDAEQPCELLPPPDPVPLVVDLDGTLLRTESSIESVLVLARKHPLSLLKLPLWLVSGRACLKQHLAQIAMPDIPTLPFRQSLLGYLREQKRAGRRLVLATAADRLLAQEVVAELGLFDLVLASEQGTNLDPQRKRERLVALFGDRGFDYVGDGRGDYPLWSSARKALLVSPSRRLARDVAAVTPVDKIIDQGGSRWADYLHALRPHHWIKNSLVFVPLAAAHRLFEMDLAGRALLAFVAFSLCASSVYLLNDLLDLPSDRRHPHKKDRRLASGQISLRHALLSLPVLLLSALALGFSLTPGFAGVLSLYFVLMLAYSIRLKDVPIVDVLVLAAGYALRVAAGFLVVAIDPSAWLLGICVFLFFSLALIKRFAELVALEPASGTPAARARGYVTRDESILAAQGIASGYLAVLLLALYANTQIAQSARPQLAWLWLLCMLLFAWLNYMWLMAGRGRMHHDPVVFAFQDRLSAWTVIAMAIVALLATSTAVAAGSPVLYEAPAKNIVELQPFRRTTTLQFTAVGGQRGTATLIDLNPRSNAWFLLTLAWAGTGRIDSYHLENPWPQTQSLTLDVRYSDGVLITAQGRVTECPLWQSGELGKLEQARRSMLPYAPLCEDRLHLRNDVAGTYTHLERITNFLRDHVWGGEKIVGFVRERFFRDAFVEQGVTGGATPPLEGEGGAAKMPWPARVSATFAASTIQPEHLGIDVGQGAGDLRLGRWYPAQGAPGIFISALQPQAIDAEILNGHRNVVGALDSVEAQALDYFVALDLSRFDLGFVLGADHPRVGWSPRVPASVRNSELPGPDGIDSAVPLVVNGMMNPTLVDKTAAAFAGGFKREHGAFRSGPLAQQNGGTHYGFIEQGIVFSKLQPGLATLLVTNDGMVQMKTWAPEDNALLAQIRHARQNGVPLIDYDAQTGASTPGVLVNRWGAGNWSGSSDERLRTLRAGACVQDTGSERFLIYGYFSTATPSAMARAFHAYGCRYAMHLDMNALEHTYFAIYMPRNGRILVQHLIEGMAVVDRKGGNELAPRFLGFPDDRDFFYLTRKE